MKLKPVLVGTVSVLAAGLMLAGCSDPTAAPAPGSSEGTVIVSSANFTESEIIGNLYALALQDAGVKVETKFNIGSREAYLPALSEGSINLIPEYTGNLLLALDAKADVSSPEAIAAALPAALANKGLVALSQAAAEDKDSIAVTRETADRWKLSSIGDLAAHNAELTLGAPPEFKERPVGLPGLKANYGVEPAKFEPFSDGGPASVKALVAGELTAANVFTTSPAITENDLVVLEDPKLNFPAQNVVPIAGKDALNDTAVAAIDAVSAKLTTAELLKLNVWVSGEQKLEPAAAAKQWLTEQGLVKSP